MVKEFGKRNSAEQPPPPFNRQWLPGYRMAAQQDDAMRSLMERWEQIEASADKVVTDRRIVATLENRIAESYARFKKERGEE
ncbi:hypothetical protein HY968_02830 [Candidatus Kaiserbacteria bacterium]|nr:hypothetical protein [Candidatus Kaiserbacteria bacterium]